MFQRCVRSFNSKHTRCMGNASDAYSEGLWQCSAQAELDRAMSSPRYLRVSDQNLSLHAKGGAAPGARETLHPCPRSRNHPNCQWDLIPSGTRPGAFYLKIQGEELYLHAKGGASPGARMTLHACPKGRNHSNCQWYIEKSRTRPGTVYLRSAGGDLYAHAKGGSRSGAEITLHACPKERNHPNCQWYLE